jgi:hypothetical protein
VDQQHLLLSRTRRALRSVGSGIRKTGVALSPAYLAIFILDKLHGLSWWQALASATAAYIGIAIVAGVSYTATIRLIRALRR